MKNLLIISICAITLVLATSCEIKKKESGKLPEVDIDAGTLPEYDVDWADVNIGTRTKLVKVPKVVVVMEEKEVEVPYVDVNLPDSDSEERVIKVEAEVSDYMHEINIEKVYAVNNKLYVISSLRKGDKPLQGQRVRISDQIIINAPEDLIVKHYIIGTPPSGHFNSRYLYIASESQVGIDTDKAKVIYND